MDDINILIQSYNTKNTKLKQYESNQLVYFNDKTNTVSRFNIETLKIDKCSLSRDLKISKFVCMCGLPNRAVFCFGNKPPSGATFIIDSSNKLIDLQDGEPCYAAGAIYYRDSVYVFGGITNNNLIIDMAEKIDLKYGIWYKLQSLPEKASQSSCVVFEEKILISGREHDRLYAYDVNSNMYCDCLVLKKDLNKVILVGDNRAYAIELGGNIYESEECSFKIWHSLGSSCLHNFISISFTTMFRDSIYFMNYDYKVYYFDINKKSISKL